MEKQSIPTQLNIAPRGKTWKNWQLVDGEDGFKTREAMEKFLCNPERVRELEECRRLNLETIERLNALLAVGQQGVQAESEAIAEIVSAGHDDAEFGERAVRFLRDFNHLEYSTKLYPHPTQQGLQQAIEWPKARDVGRFGDMSPGGFIRVGLDADNDVYVSICDGKSVADIEFCTPGGGGGRSSRTRVALIALMCAIEADNASHPAFDFWQRSLAAQAKQGGV